MEEDRQYSAEDLEELKQVIGTKFGWLKFNDVHDWVKDDRDIALISVRLQPKIYYMLSDRLHDDEEILKTVLAHDIDHLEHASDRLRDSEEIIRLALQTEAREPSLCETMKFASDRLRDNEELALLALEANPDNLKHLSRRIQSLIELYDPEFENPAQSLRKAMSDYSEIHKATCAHNSKPGRQLAI